MSTLHNYLLSLDKRTLVELLIDSLGDIIVDHGEVPTPEKVLEDAKLRLQSMKEKQ